MVASYAVDTNPVPHSVVSGLAEDPLEAQHPTRFGVVDPRWMLALPVHHRWTL